MNLYNLLMDNFCVVLVDSRRALKNRLSYIIEVVLRAIIVFGILFSGN